MQQSVDTLINGPARYTQEHHFSSGWALVFVLAVLAIQCGAVYFLFLLTVKFFQYARTFFSAFLRRVSIGKHEVEYTFLQLIFPSDTTKSAYATEHLHILMRSMVKYRGFWDRLAARKQPYSLELVATKISFSIHTIKTATIAACSCAKSSRFFGTRYHFAKQPRQQAAHACWAINTG